MRRVDSPWIGVLGLNLAWLLVLPGKTAKAAALAGAATALIAVVMPVLSSRVRLYLRDIAGDEVTIAAAALVFPFLLPAVSLVATPRIAFLNLEGGVWLIVAWVWTGVALSFRRSTADGSEKSPAVRSATLLLLFWTSALWLIVVSAVGIGRVVLETDRTVPKECRSDTLTTVFSIWEATPAREHLFLAWRSLESFHSRTPYANHGHPYLLTMYAWSRTVRAATGAPMYVATNTVPFLYIAAILASFTTLIVRAGLLRGRLRPIGLLTLFVAYGWIVTGWRFWNDLYRYNSDNPYPLLLAVLLLIYAFLLSPGRPALAAVSAAVFVALSPIHAPMLILAVLILFGHRAATFRSALNNNRPVLLVSLCAFIAGVISYLVPRLLIAWKGYVGVSSSYMLRSGLDGDMRYFSNAVQAVFAPCSVGCCFTRTADELIWPAFVPLLLAAVLALRKELPRRLSIGHLLLFLTTPYWISLILFPQSVSIHPYLYDHLLLVPVIVAGSATVLMPEVETRLRGAALLTFALISGGLLMANLIALAQAAAAMPR